MESKINVFFKEDIRSNKANVEVTQNGNKYLFYYEYFGDFDIIQCSKLAMDCFKDTDLYLCLLDIIEAITISYNKKLAFNQ